MLEVECEEGDNPYVCIRFKDEKLARSITSKAAKSGIAKSVMLTKLHPKMRSEDNVETLFDLSMPDVTPLGREIFAT